MKQTVKITIPTSWSEVTLKKYLELQADIKNYEDDEEAQSAFLLQHLCGIDVVQLQSLSKNTYNEIKNTLLQFINNTSAPLQRIVIVDGVEYGFEPNLSNMAYGAYVDITKYNELTIDNNWAKIMSILYRPVTDKRGDTYGIKEYDGTIDGDKWLNVGMDVHFGALFFFVRLSMDLLNSTLNSTITKTVEAHPEYKLILEKSGEVTRQLLNSQMVTLGRLMK